MSKRLIQEDEWMAPYLDKETLSRFDSVQLLLYAIAMYSGGVIGDIYD